MLHTDTVGFVNNETDVNKHFDDFKNICYDINPHKIFLKVKENI